MFRNRRILVTGARGFIGAEVSRQLCLSGASVVATSRDKVENGLNGLTWFRTGSVGPETDWRSALKGVDCIVHAAARVHALERVTKAEFHRVNVMGTARLAEQAVEMGVRRFLFISSVAVNGSVSRQPFTERDEPDPQTAYASSKAAAEVLLRQMSQRSALDVVVIRPPMVYGPRAPGNFGRLVNAIRTGLPLPFGAIRNKRTLIGLDNLVDLILTCIRTPEARNELFLAGDAEDLSTTDLTRRLGVALGRRVHLIPVPATLITFGAALVGKSSIGRSLCGSLQVDISKARERLQWNPPYSVEAGLAKAALGYVAPDVG